MSKQSEMPFPPEAVPLGDNNFVLGTTSLGRFERELAAGRIVKTSRAEGGWVGLSKLRLRTDAYNTHVRAVEYMNRHRERRRSFAFKEKVYASEIRKAITLSILTLGIYRLIKLARGTWPKPPAPVLEEEEKPYFGDFNSEDFAIGLEELIEHGFVMTQQNPENPDDMLIFPTPKLVAGIHPLN